MDIEKMGIVISVLLFAVGISFVVIVLLAKFFLVRVSQDISERGKRINNKLQLEQYLPIVHSLLMRLTPLGYQEIVRMVSTMAGNAYIDIRIQKGELVINGHHYELYDNPEDDYAVASQAVTTVQLTAHERNASYWLSPMGSNTHKCTAAMINDEIKKLSEYALSHSERVIRLTVDARGVLISKHTNDNILISKSAIRTISKYVTPADRMESNGERLTRWKTT